MLYRQWILDLEGFLTDQGATADELAAVTEQIENAIVLPSGEPFDSDAHWARFNELIDQVVAAAGRGDAAAARGPMDEAKEIWRQTHDRDVDHTYGLMSAIVVHSGEAIVPQMYDRVLLPLFAWRYEKFDIDKHPWDEGLEALMYVACEAMRGHLVGPERTGDMELVETEDRYIVRFDPCGSGQRTIRGDWIEGTPARMEPPYNWKVSEEEHDWNHFKKGTCFYCAHCIVLMEHMPMDRFGYPVRVVDPPTLPGHEQGSRRAAEVPVADVQGSDERAGGVLHPQRAHQAHRLRLDPARRAAAAERGQLRDAGRRLRCRRVRVRR